MNQKKTTSLVPEGTKYGQIRAGGGAQLVEPGAERANLINSMDEIPPPPPNEGTPPPPPPTVFGSPTDFLKGVVGKRVIVRLTSGVDYSH